MASDYFFAAIRKLTGKRAKVEGKLDRRDVIQDFSNYGSQTYAPLTRIGMFLDRGSEQFVVKSKHLSTYQGNFCILSKWYQYCSNSNESLNMSIHKDKKYCAKP